MLIAPLLLAFAFQPASPPPVPPTPPTPPVPVPTDWNLAESALLRDHVQLTSRDMFIKAGEAYFDHASPPRWVIFQAIPVPAAGAAPDPFYSMYIAKLRYRGGAGTPGAPIEGIETPIRISPPGSANTCGWFIPNSPVVLFASTLEPPSSTNQPGYQRGTGKYRWEFPREMRIVQRAVLQLEPPPGPETPTGARCGNDYLPTAIVGEGDGYVAEGSLSPDGRFLIFTRMIDAASKNLDIFVRDTRTGEEHTLVAAPGYDGGPFFSPDGKRICYRSDRAGNDLLQVYTADLTFDADGVPTGTEHEQQLTANEHVNWGPYWHPSGEFLVYASSEMGHTNYEIFAAEVPARGKMIAPAKVRRRRITNAPGADVLPVFSDDGKYMMWTSQRGPAADGEAKPSSQVWATSFSAVGDGAGNLFSNTSDQPASH